MLKRKLFRTALGYKAQFISMIIMIAIGVGVFVGFNMEWVSLEKDVTEFLDDTEYADYRIYNEMGFSKEEIDAISGIEGVDAASRVLSVNVGIKDTKDALSLFVVEDYVVSTMLVQSGEEYSEESDGFWISDKYAAKNNISVGDEIVLTYRGMEIAGEVKGLVKSGEYLICVVDENQLMPDFDSFGYVYAAPKKIAEAIGMEFYPQINIISKLSKEELENEIRDAINKTTLVVSKDDHMSYAGAMSEVEEGKTMGAILPILFLLIALLTMVTTMHRITANEKTQIGTLKALGFKDRKILTHYTSYGFSIGLIGTLLGVLLGFAIAGFVINPNGMMGTYLDMPVWKLYLPWFCWPLAILTVLFLTAIGYLSVKEMLKGTAADALRPYTPKKMKAMAIEKFDFFHKLPFATKWNLRDIWRHKARSFMTLIGVIGCMLLLVGGLGMKDTMDAFMSLLDEGISNYTTRINLADTSDNESARKLAEQVNGDWQATAGISYEGRTITMEVHDEDKDLLRFLNEENELVRLGDEGVYLCLRLKDTAAIGDTIEFSPYGSDETYEVKVAGYLRSVMSEAIIMTDTYADHMGIEYHIGAIFTDKESEDIEDSSIISGKQDKDMIMATYDSFMEIMNLMVGLFVVAAVVLGVVVLYNLGVMSYLERHRELATLKVLGFRDKHIGKLLISQNIWLTVRGVIIGLPGGVAV